MTTLVPSPTNSASVASPSGALSPSARSAASSMASMTSMTSSSNSSSFGSASSVHTNGNAMNATTVSPYSSLASKCIQQGHYHQAMDYYQKALREYEAKANAKRSGSDDATASFIEWCNAAATLFNLGALAKKIQNYEQAVVFICQSQALYQHCWDILEYCDGNTTASNANADGSLNMDATGDGDSNGHNGNANANGNSDNGNNALMTTAAVCLTQLLVETLQTRAHIYSKYCYQYENAMQCHQEAIQFMERTLDAMQLSSSNAVEGPAAADGQPPSATNTTQPKVNPCNIYQVVYDHISFSPIDHDRCAHLLSQSYQQLARLTAEFSHDLHEANRLYQLALHYLDDAMPPRVEKQRRTILQRMSHIEHLITEKQQRRLRRRLLREQSLEEHDGDADHDGVVDDGNSDVDGHDGNSNVDQDGQQQHGDEHQAANADHETNIDDSTDNDNSSHAHSIRLNMSIDTIHHQQHDVLGSVVDTAPLASQEAALPSVLHTSKKQPLRRKNVTFAPAIQQQQQSEHDVEQYPSLNDAQTSDPVNDAMAPAHADVSPLRIQIQQHAQHQQPERSPVSAHPTPVNSPFAAISLYNADGNHSDDDDEIHFNVTQQQAQQLMQTGEYDLALQCWETLLLQQCQKHGQESLPVARALQPLGHVLICQDNVEGGLDLYKAALDTYLVILHDDGDSDGDDGANAPVRQQRRLELAVLHREIGRAHFQLREFAQANQYLLESLEWFARLSNDTTEELQVYELLQQIEFASVKADDTDIDDANVEDVAATVNRSISASAANNKDGNDQSENAMHGNGQAVASLQTVSSTCVAPYRESSNGRFPSNSDSAAMVDGRFMYNFCRSLSTIEEKKEDDSTLLGTAASKDEEDSDEEDLDNIQLLSMPSQEQPQPSWQPHGVFANSHATENGQGVTIDDVMEHSPAELVKMNLPLPPSQSFDSSDAPNTDNAKAPQDGGHEIPSQSKSEQGHVPESAGVFHHDGQSSHDGSVNFFVEADNNIVCGAPVTPSSLTHQNSNSNKLVNTSSTTVATFESSSKSSLSTRSSALLLSPHTLSATTPPPPPPPPTTTNGAAGTSIQHHGRLDSHSFEFTQKSAKPKRSISPSSTLTARTLRHQRLQKQMLSLSPKTTKATAPTVTTDEHEDENDDCMNAPSPAGSKHKTHRRATSLDSSDYHLAMGIVSHPSNDQSSVQVSEGNLSVHDESPSNWGSNLFDAALIENDHGGNVGFGGRDGNVASVAHFFETNAFERHADDVDREVAFGTRGAPGTVSLDDGLGMETSRSFAQASSATAAQLSLSMMTAATANMLHRSNGGSEYGAHDFIDNRHSMPESPMLRAIASPTRSSPSPGESSRTGLLNPGARKDRSGAGSGGSKMLKLPSLSGSRSHGLKPRTKDGDGSMMGDLKVDTSISSTSTKNRIVKAFSSPFRRSKTSTRRNSGVATTASSPSPEPKSRQTTTTERTKSQRSPRRPVKSTVEELIEEADKEIAQGLHIRPPVRTVTVHHTQRPSAGTPVASHGSDANGNGSGDGNSSSAESNGIGNGVGDGDGKGNGGDPRNANRGIEYDYDDGVSVITFIVDPPEPKQSSQEGQWWWGVSSEGVEGWFPSISQAVQQAAGGLLTGKTFHDLVKVRPLDFDSDLESESDNSNGNNGGGNVAAAPTGTTTTKSKTKTTTGRTKTDGGKKRSVKSFEDSSRAESNHHDASSRDRATPSVANSRSSSAVVSRDTINAASNDASIKRDIQSVVSQSFTFEATDEGVECTEISLHGSTPNVVAADASAPNSPSRPRVAASADRQITASASVGAVAPTPKENSKHNTLATEIADLEALLKREEEVHGKDSAAVATTLFKLSVLYTKTRRSDATVACVSRALQIQKAHGNLAEAARSLHILANVHCDHAQYQLALSCYSEAKQLQETAFGDYHEEVAKTLNCIGNVLARQGEFDLAMENHKEALHILKECIGEDLKHPLVSQTLIQIGAVYYKERNSLSTIQSNNDGYSTFIEGGMLEVIGRAHDDRGSYRMAIAFFEEKLQFLGEGADLEQKTETLNSLGMLSRRAGLYMEALDYYEQASDAQAKLGQDDVQQTIGQILKAAVYYDLGRFQKALELMQLSLKSLISKVGNEHETVAATMFQIGIIHSRLCRYTAAMESFREALEIQHRLIGDMHPATLRTIREIGNLYTVYEADLPSAFEEFEYVLQMQNEIHGERHPNIAETLHSLGIAQAHKDGGIAAALITFEKCYNMRLEFLGMDHPAQATTLVEIAKLHLKRNRVKKALHIADAALNIRTESLSDKHLDVAIAMSCKATCLVARGETAEAAKLFEQAIPIAEQAVGTNHPDVGDIYVQMGRMDLRCCRFENATANIEKALQCYRGASLDEDHPGMKEATAELGNVERAEMLCV